MDEIIKVKQLSKSYHHQPAVKNLDLSVKRGTIFGLLGANGAGKSTTIECILGTKKCDEGSITILGMDPKKDRKTLFQKVGVQFQEANYQEQITVAELCAVTASLYRNPANYEDLLAQFNLEDKKKSLVKELSGGQRQSLFVILALIPDPKLIFLDELTTGLDPRARRDVWKILNQLKENGITMLLTSHFMDEVETLCDQICILKQGEVIFTGTVPQAIERSSYDKLEDAYLWFTEQEEFYENI